MRCLFVAVAAQRLFQPSLRANPSYTPVMQEVQAPYVPVQPVVVMPSPAPGASDWIAANPITSCAAIAGLAFFATNRLSALGVIGRPATATPRTDIEMNTPYNKAVLDAIGRKKSPKTGDSSNLKGYTVGSRAPKTARASGLTNQFGYGIGNLYGGGSRGGSAIVGTKSKEIKGKMEVDTNTTLLRLGVLWAGCTVLFLLGQAGAAARGF
jgi:hypothetical protein